MSTVSFRTAANGCASALAIACLLLLAFSEKGVAQTIIPRVPLMEVAHPPDPTGDFVWSGGFGGVADIQDAFNRARATENANLGIFLEPMKLPSQSIWNGMTEGERALWLVNQERTARDLKPLDGLEKKCE